MVEELLEEELEELDDPPLLEEDEETVKSPYSDDSLSDPCKESEGSN
jgi:hypothetical protein